MGLVVAPLVGARIEMLSTLSLDLAYVVAPLVGARIEIQKLKKLKKHYDSRSPRGSAD